MLALIARGLGEVPAVFVAVPFDLPPDEPLKRSAMRARDVKISLVRSLEPLLDLRNSFDCWSRNEADLSVVKVGRSLDCELEGIALLRRAIAINLVCHHDSDRPRGETRGRVRTDEREVAAGVVFHADRRG